MPEDTLRNWTLHLGRNEDKEKSDAYQIAKIQAVTLYRYFNGIFLLAFRVEPLALCQLRNKVDDPLFSNEGRKSLFDLSLLHPAHKAAYEQLQLEYWLRFTKLARLLYPSFTEQEEEKKLFRSDYLMVMNQKWKLSRTNHNLIFKTNQENCSLGLSAIC